MKFTRRAWIDTIHLHMTIKAMAGFSLYLDINDVGADDVPDDAETLIKTETTNANLDYAYSMAASYVGGLRVVFSKQCTGTGSSAVCDTPALVDVNAFLTGDTDGDGLTDGQEASNVYYQEAHGGGLPRAIPDGSGAVNNTSVIKIWKGVLSGAFTQVQVTHPSVSDLQAFIGYWDGKAWNDRVVWDPGRRVSDLTITYPGNGMWVDGTVTVTAVATQLGPITGVSFFVDGNSMAVVSGTADGSTYSWPWVTSGYASGPHTLTVQATGADGLTYHHQITPNVDNSVPYLAILAPASGSTVSGTLDVQVNAWDDYRVAQVNYYLAPAGTTSSQSIGYATTSPYDLLWNSASVCDASYTLSAVALDYAGKQSTPQSITITTANNIAWGTSGGGGGGGGHPHKTPRAGAFAPGDTPSTLQYGACTCGWNPSFSQSGSVTVMILDLLKTKDQLLYYEVNDNIKAPAFPSSYFHQYDTWRVVVYDYVTGNKGTLDLFTLRTEEKTSPTNPDTDGDGIPDGVEEKRLGTIPTTDDSDADGLTDAFENAPHWATWSLDGKTVVQQVKTRPNVADTDGDGLPDGQEWGVTQGNQTKVIGEVGFLQGLGTAWTTVYLHNHYTSPVVFTGPLTYRDTAEAHARVAGVTDHTFQVRVETWTTSDAAHGPEDLAYLVLESGEHYLADGTRVSLGTMASASGSAPASLTYRNPFGVTPLVLLQTQTLSDAHAVVAKVYGPGGGPTPSGFQAYLLSPGGYSHGAETVGYLAIDPPASSDVSGWVRGLPTITLSGSWSFPATLVAPPLLLAWFQTDPSGAADRGIRVKTLTATSATLQVELGTYAEPLAALAFPSASNVTARVTTNPNGSDTDGDGLSDGLEVNTYGSSPILTDTDGDGIPDNVEVTQRSLIIPVNGAFKAFGYQTSPISDDTDGDGIKDPDELAGVLAHKTLHLTMDSPVRDMSGNGARVYDSGTTATTGASAKVGTGRSFSGSQSLRVTLAPTPKAWTTLRSAITLCAWINNDETQVQPILEFDSGVHFWQWNSANLLFVNFVDSNGVGHSFSSDGSNLGGATILQVGTTTLTKNKWQFVCAVYDGNVGYLYIDVGAPTTAMIGSVTLRTDVDLFVGNRPRSNYYYKGLMDEVQVWDRPLSSQEIRGLYDISSNPSTVITRLDMETWSSGSSLYDFSGNGRVGTVTGTLPMEGAIGFARRFSGAQDGISVAGIGTASFSGVTVAAYVFIPSHPSVDVPMVAGRGAFYLNLTSDGRVAWTIYLKGTLASPLPLAMNRWVSVVAVASTSGSTLYLDGAQAAMSSTPAAPPSKAQSLEVAYTQSSAHFVGGIDEILVLGTTATAATIVGQRARGILLNPALADTDGDGIPDGQELSVNVTRTKERYPIPDGSRTTTDSLAWEPGAPAWAIQSVQIFVGVTHPDLGQLELDLNWGNNLFLLKPSGTGSGQANLFTTYDFLARTSTTGYRLARGDLHVPGMYLFLAAFDTSPGKVGQVEYLQVQTTSRSLPNWADTDLDGLSDKEELQLGTDGYHTDPWNPDSDYDSIPDSLEYAGWSRGCCGAAVPDPNGFHTDPTRADTDRDGVNDYADYFPLGDAFVEVRVDSATVRGKDNNNPDAIPSPFVGATIRDNSTWTNHFVSSFSTKSFAAGYDRLGYMRAFTKPLTLDYVLTESPTLTMTFSGYQSISNGQSMSFFLDVKEPNWASYQSYFVGSTTANDGYFSVTMQGQPWEAGYGPFNLFDGDFVFGEVQWYTVDPTPYSFNLAFSMHGIDPISTDWSGHHLSVNVPDGSRTISFQLQMFSFDSRNTCGGNPCNAHSPIIIDGCANSNTVTRDYDITSGSATFQLWGNTCSATPGLYAAPLTVELRTVVPKRAEAYLIVPANYSSVYNVTDTKGAIVSLRYTGESRFVGLILNVDSVLKVVLVPEFVFLRSPMYQKLGSGNPGTILGKLQFANNSSSSTVNSDGLEFIIGGSVTGYEFDQASDSLMNLLLYDTSGSKTYMALHLTNQQTITDLLLYSLPDDPLRLVSYLPMDVSKSIPYTICGTCQPYDIPWWEKIWEGVVTFVKNVLTSAYVLVTSVISNLVDYIRQFGGWVSDLTSNDPQRVMRAVNAAKHFADQLFDGLKELFLTPVRAFMAYLDNWKNSVLRGAYDYAAAIQAYDGSSQSLRRMALALVEFLLALFPPEIMVALGILTVALEGAYVATMATGVGAVIIGIVLSAIVALFISALLKLAAPALDILAQTLSNYVGSLRKDLVGLALGVGGLVLTIIQWIHAPVFKGSLTVIWTDDLVLVSAEIREWDPVRSVKGLVEAILGLALVFIAGLVDLAGKNLWAAIVVDAAALTLGVMGLIDAVSGWDSELFGRIALGLDTADTLDSFCSFERDANTLANTSVPTCVL